jgi:putative MATE family efflux protein
MELTRDPIPGLIRRIAMPASIGFFFNTMYNVVDTYYGGLISTQALAALSLSFPVFFVVIAMGSGISTGSTALIANALGSGRKDKGKLLAAQAISFGMMVAIILTVAGILASPLLFSLLGASGQYLDDAVAYMSVIFLGSVFFMTSHVLNAGLGAMGDTRTFRDFLVAGFFMNLVLDPWFVFGGLGIPALGLTGVAWATVLIQAIGTVYMTYKVCKRGLLCMDSFTMMRPRKRPYLEIAKQGFPASLNMMTVALGIFIIIFFVSWFGNEAVAAYGVATRIEQIALLPTIGLNIAALSLCGQNRGAGRFDRVAETVGLTIRYGLLVMIPGVFAVFLFAEPLMAFFTTSSAVIAIGSNYLRIAAFIFWGYVILFTSVSALQGIKRPLYAVWIGLYRQIAGPALLFHLLATVLGWGLYGIWWGIFILVWTSTIITILYTRHAIKSLVREGPDEREGPPPKEIMGSPRVLRMKNESH